MPPKWDLCVQLFDQAFADSFEFDVLDPTKIIPEEVLKPEVVGTMTLDRVVDNFFAETEQVAFCTQNVVPGIDFTDDPLLQGRNFSYLDTQLKRLGSPNFTKIPVNAPKGCPVSNYQQDGHMQTAQHIRGPRELRAERLGRGPARGSARGLHELSASRCRAKSGGCGRRASTTTTARHGSSTSARPRSSRTTSATRSCSNCRNARWRRSASASCRTCSTSTRVWPRASPNVSGSPRCRSPRRRRSRRAPISRHRRRSASC